MRIPFVAVAISLLVALVPQATAHPGPGDDPWHASWHDVGEDLGWLGPNPLGAPTGVCWMTDSALLADPRLEEINGHRVGIAVDPDRDCDGEAVDDGDPGTAARVYASSLFLPGVHDGKALKVDVRANGLQRELTLPDPDHFRLSDVTDPFATILNLDSGRAATLAPDAQGDYRLRAWVMDYRGVLAGERLVGQIFDLGPRIGEDVVLRIWDQRALDAASTPVDEAPCGTDVGLLVLCGTIGDSTFQLLHAENGLSIALPEATLEGFHGREVAMSLFVDISDERYDLFGSAELGAQG